MITDCDMPCTRERKYPVCASDGKTYSSDCKLATSACKTGNKDLTIVHNGKCKGKQYNKLDQVIQKYFVIKTLNSFTLQFFCFVLKFQLIK